VNTQRISLIIALALLVSGGLVHLAYAQEEATEVGPITETPAEISAEAGFSAADLPRAGITPENPFYFLDKWGEIIQEFITLNPQAKARLQVKFAAERISEIKIILETKGVEAKGLDIAQIRLEAHAKKATDIVEKEKEKGSEISKLAGEIVDSFHAQRRAVKEIFEEARDAFKTQKKELQKDLIVAIENGDIGAQEQIRDALLKIELEKDEAEIKKDAAINTLEEEKERLHDELDEEKRKEDETRDALEEARDVERETLEKEFELGEKRLEEEIERLEKLQKRDARERERLEKELRETNEKLEKEGEEEEKKAEGKQEKVEEKSLDRAPSTQLETTRKEESKASVGKSTCASGEDRRCSGDITAMCSPNGEERQYVSSSCSCGTDASTLAAQGFKTCPVLEKTVLMPPKQEESSAPTIEETTIEAPLEEAVVVEIAPAPISEEPATEENVVVEVVEPVPEPEPELEKVTVTLFPTGFSPALVTIKKGQTVIFSNKSLRSMWIASNVHPTHSIYSGFDQRASVGHGRTFEFTFDRIGRWGYHNHVNTSGRGTIVVEE